MGRDVPDQLVPDPEGGPVHEFRCAVFGEHTDREDLPQRVLAEMALGAPREHEPDGPEQGGEQAGIAENGERDEPRHVDRVAADGLTVERDRAVRVCDESGRAAVHLEERGPHEAVAHEGGVAEPPKEELAQTRHRAPVEERQMQASDRGHVLPPRGVELAEPVTDGKLLALSTHRVDHSATGSPWRTGLWDILSGLLAWSTTIQAYFLANGKIWKTILSITFKRLTRTSKPARFLNGTARSVNKLKNVASTSPK